MKARYLDLPIEKLPHPMSMSTDFWEMERRNREVQVDPTPYTEGVDAAASYLCKPLFEIFGVKSQVRGLGVVACACLLVFDLGEFEHQFTADYVNAGAREEALTKAIQHLLI